MTLCFGHSSTQALARSATGSTTSPVVRHECPALSGLLTHVSLLLLLLLTDPGAQCDGKDCQQRLPSMPCLTRGAVRAFELATVGRVQLQLCVR
jgi:hypothetical protein